MALDGKQSDFFGLILCGVLFIGGSIAGSVMAGFFQDGETLSRYVAAFLDAYKTQPQTDFFAALISTVKYHVAAVFLGFSVLGPLLIPALSAVRGFFLSFSVTAVLRCLGVKGIGFTLSLFGIPAVISIPCFFILSTLAFSSSFHILRLVRAHGARALSSPFCSRLLASCCACLILLVAPAAADTYLISRLVPYAASRITF